MKKIVPALAAIALLAGCTSPEKPQPVSTGDEASIINQLKALPIKGRAPKTGYSREKFGKGWVDVDNDGCDTRNQILQRDLKDTLTRGCQVIRGTLEDPYTGKTIHFFRDGTDGAPDLNGDGIPGWSEEVQIDHVVALSDAWQKGAQGWSQEKRTLFANDPLNLLAVDGEANQEKSDSDAASWLPARSFWCSYSERQIEVKTKYALSVTKAEENALEKALGTCKNGASDGTETSSMPSETPSENAEPRFKNCKEAKEAGYGPYKRGETEYSWYQDSDGDGIVCE